MNLIVTDITSHALVKKARRKNFCIHGPFPETGPQVILPSGPVYITSIWLQAAKDNADVTIRSNTEGNFFLKDFKVKKNTPFRFKGNINDLDEFILHGGLVTEIVKGSELFGQIRGFQLVIDDDAEIAPTPSTPY